MALLDEAKIMVNLVREHGVFDDTGQYATLSETSRHFLLPILWSDRTIAML